jgi:hypothetical protein
MLTGASRSELIRRAVRSQYGAGTPERRLAALRASAGIWSDRSGTGVDYVEELRQTRRRWLARSELARRLRAAQADPGLRDGLASLAGDTTEGLGPIR